MGQANSRSELLWQMSGYGNKVKVKEILAEGVADPNWVSLDDNSTSLMVAAGSKKGDVHLIRLLLHAGADVSRKDNRDNVALHHAAMRGDVDVIKALVEAGSDINAQNRQSWTPLMNACYWCKPDATAAFIELGAKVDLLNNEKRSALHELCRSPFELYTCKEEDEEEEEVKEAEEEKESELPRPPREERKTLEEMREERRKKEERERERKARRKAREPALAARREEELAEMACLLIDAGCDVDRQSQSYGEEDFTPLLYAAFHNHAEIALVLTQCEEKKVNVNYQGGDNQWTALHWASDRGNVDMVQLLLDAGADPWRRGARGEVAADRARDDRLRTILLNAQNKATHPAVDDDDNISSPLPRILSDTPASSSTPTVIVTTDDDDDDDVSSYDDINLDLTPLKMMSDVVNEDAGMSISAAAAAASSEPSTGIDSGMEATESKTSSSMETFPSSTSGPTTSSDVSQ